MRKVILGGTFAYLHKGHMALLRKAFESGDFVHIGITTDGYVKRHKSGTESYSDRKRNVEAFASRTGKPYSISQLRDRYGPSLRGDFYAIVVSRETRPVAERINSIRERRGLKPMLIITIPFKMAYDGRPISSRRIQRHEIDREGRAVVLRSPRRARAGHNQI